MPLGVNVSCAWWHNQYFDWVHLNFWQYYFTALTSTLFQLIHLFSPRKSTSMIKLLVWETFTSFWQLTVCKGRSLGITLHRSPVPHRYKHSNFLKMQFCLSSVRLSPISSHTIPTLKTVLDPILLSVPQLKISLKLCHRMKCQHSMTFSYFNFLAPCTCPIILHSRLSCSTCSVRKCP